MSPGSDILPGGVRFFGRQKKLLRLLAFSSIFLTSLYSKDNQDDSLWDFSAGLAATYLQNGGADVATTYWGPRGTAGYQATESLHARGELSHSQNRLIYDGQGGVARQSQSLLATGLGWDASEKWNFDLEYGFTFGENAYKDHAVAATVEFLPIDNLTLGADASYGSRSYNFPVTNLAVAATSTAYSLDIVPEFDNGFSFPISGILTSSRYSTNSSAYTVYSLSAGTEYRTGDHKWLFGANIVPGRDSSGYTIIGADMRVRLRLTDHLAIRVFASYTSYSYTVTQTSKGKKQSGSAVNPLGNSDTFAIGYAGIDTTYYF